MSLPLVLQSSEQENVFAGAGSSGAGWPPLAGRDNDGIKQNASQCVSTLRRLCVPNPPSWNRLQFYNMGGVGGGEGYVPCGPPFDPVDAPHKYYNGTTAQDMTDYTSEFLLTRGPYAYLGYSWCGCTDGAQTRPRAREWDEDDVGEPVGGAACAEVGESGVFKREWTRATVVWNCSAGHGRIERKPIG